MLHSLPAAMPPANHACCPVVCAPEGPAAEQPGPACECTGLLQQFTRQCGRQHVSRTPCHGAPGLWRARARLCLLRLHLVCVPLQQPCRQLQRRAGALVHSDKSRWQCRRFDLAQRGSLPVGCVKPAFALHAQFSLVLACTRCYTPKSCTLQHLIGVTRPDCSLVSTCNAYQARFEPVHTELITL